VFGEEVDVKNNIKISKHKQKTKIYSVMDLDYQSQMGHEGIVLGEGL
jgi:hypothetical protein